MDALIAILGLFGMQLIGLGFWSVVMAIAVVIYRIKAPRLGREEAERLLSDPKSYQTRARVLDPEAVKAVSDRLNRRHSSYYNWASVCLVGFTVMLVVTIFAGFDIDHPEGFFIRMGICYVFIFTMIWFLIMARTVGKVAAFFEEVLRQQALLVGHDDPDASKVGPSSTLATRQPQDVMRRSR